MIELECACASVRRASRLVTQVYGRALGNTAGKPLEPSQYLLLSALREMPGSAQTALGNALGLEKATLSRNLRLMEKNGWIAPSAKGRDGRQRGFALTAAGRQLHRAATPGWNQAQQAMQGAMTAEEWRAMWKGIRIMTRAARSLGQSSLV